jgi:hypothetical protein
MKNLQKYIFFIIISITFLGVSCKTSQAATLPIDPENPYPNMEIVRFSASQAYFFPNEMSSKLLIVIEGGDWASVLGEKENNKWVSIKYGALLIHELGNKYNVLIPEKLKRQPGLVYKNDMEDRANYTAENLIDCYIESINSHLDNHTYSSILLVGTSEGANLLPILYEKISKKNNVTAMVSISYGGLSMYESYEILSTRKHFPQEWLEMYSDALSLFNPKNTEFRNTFEEDYYDLTYRWWNSFKYIRPYDYYKNIDIPILFIHGVDDYKVPAESTIYIQKNLPKKPFEYLYYPWTHQPQNIPDTLRLIKDITKWIIKVDKMV